MATRVISDAWFARIKAATRDLFKLCGGIERSAAVASVSKTEAGRWHSATEPDVISLTAVIALEAECGLPIVTTVMADLAGRRLSDPGDEQALAAAVFERHAELMRQMAEVVAAGAKAAADGHLTAAEADMMCRSLGAMERTIAEQRMDLAAAKGPRVVRG